MHRTLNIWLSLLEKQNKLLGVYKPSGNIWVYKSSRLFTYLFIALPVDAAICFKTVVFHRQFKIKRRWDEKQKVKTNYKTLKAEKLKGDDLKTRMSHLDFIHFRSIDCIL